MYHSFAPRGPRGLPPRITRASSASHFAACSSRVAAHFMNCINLPRGIWPVTSPCAKPAFLHVSSSCCVHNSLPGTGRLRHWPPRPPAPQVRARQRVLSTTSGVNCFHAFVGTSKPSVCNVPPRLPFVRRLYRLRPPWRPPSSLSSDGSPMPKTRGEPASSSDSDPTRKAPRRDPLSSSEGRPVPKGTHSDPASLASSPTSSSDGAPLSNNICRDSQSSSLSSSVGGGRPKPKACDNPSSTRSSGSANLALSASASVSLSPASSRKSSSTPVDAASPAALADAAPAGPTSATTSSPTTAESPPPASAPATTLSAPTTPALPTSLSAARLTKPFCPPTACFSFPFERRPFGAPTTDRIHGALSGGCSTYPDNATPTRTWPAEASQASAPRQRPVPDPKRQAKHSSSPAS